MINGSFVFGMDDDDDNVFRRTVDWAIANGITTATFHIQTPYPGTRLYARMEQQGRIATRNWDLYDTRHVVYRPARLAPDTLEAGYTWAYREFYRWPSIAHAARTHESLKHQAKHFTYASGWKKFEAAWNFVIRLRQLRRVTPILEAVLSEVTGTRRIADSLIEDSRDSLSSRDSLRNRECGLMSDSAIDEQAERLTFQLLGNRDRSVAARVLTP
jgi:radical SAM superfamily enzyme YgiQ (UPF0313 family)